MMTRFISYLRDFHRNEDGAATVDWVVGTAGAVGLGLAVTSAVGDGTTSLADKVSSHIAGIEFNWTEPTNLAN